MCIRDRVLAAQASKAVPKITTIPELKGIHMEADARLAMLTMTATNQEVSIRASMPAAVEESGSAVIPADLLPDKMCIRDRHPSA